jgi:hypothetical protein
MKHPKKLEKISVIRGKIALVNVLKSSYIAQKFGKSKQKSLILWSHN